VTRVCVQCSRSDTFCLLSSYLENVKLLSNVVKKNTAEVKHNILWLC